MSIKNTALILIIVIAMLNLWHMGLDIHLPSFPAIIEELLTTSNLVQLTVVFTIAGFGLSQFFYGPLSDFYGRRIIALIGLIIFILGTALAIITPNIEVLLLARFIQGLGLGAAGTVTGAIMRDIFSGNKLIQAFSYISIAIALSPLVAPLIGGYIQEYIGWRANFGFLFIYAVILFSLFYLLVPETNPYIANTTLTLKNIIANYKEVIINKNFLALVCSMILIYAGEIAYLITIPIIFQNELGLLPIQTGWLIVVSGSGLLIGSAINSRLINHYASMTLLTIGVAFVFTGAISMLVLALLLAMNVIIIILPMLIYMVGVGFIFPNCLGNIMNLFPEKAGLTNSVMAGMLMLGVGLINSVTAWLPDNSQLPLAILLFSLSILLVLNYRFFIIR